MVVSGAGWVVAIAWRVSVSVMTCPFAESRSLREDAPAFRSRAGMRVASMVEGCSSASWEVQAGSSAGNGPSPWITWHTVAAETPDSGSGCRMVGFVR